MSIPNKRTIKCPKCGKEIEFTLWQSINTDMPFAIPDIISGKLFERSQEHTTTARPGPGLGGKSGRRKHNGTQSSTNATTDGYHHGGR